MTSYFSDRFSLRGGFEGVDLKSGLEEEGGRMGGGAHLASPQERRSQVTGRGSRGSGGNCVR